MNTNSYGIFSSVQNVAVIYKWSIEMQLKRAKCMVWRYANRFNFIEKNNNTNVVTTLVISITVVSILIDPFIS